VVWRAIALNFLFATTVFILIFSRVALIICCCRKDVTHSTYPLSKETT
jgi:hypothetical protein